MTTDGKEALQQHNTAAEEPRSRPHGPHAESHRGPRMGSRHEHPHHDGPHATPELHALHDENKAIEHLMRAAVRASRGDPAVVKQLQGILGQARDALSQVLNQLATQPPYEAPQATQDAPVTESESGPTDIV